MNREAQIAEFRTQADLAALVADVLDDFCFQAACDGRNGEQPIDPKTALIELSAEAMIQAVLEDGKDVRGVVDAVMARFRERCGEVAAS